MTDDDDNDSSGYGELLVGEAYDDDVDEIAAIDDNGEEQGVAETKDSPWRHAGLPNSLGNNSPTILKFDLRRWRDETPGPRPRTAGKLPEWIAACEIESNSYPKNPTADEQTPSISPCLIYSESTTLCQIVGVVGKRPNTVTERDLK